MLFFGGGSDKCKDIIQHQNAEFIEGIYPSAKGMMSLAEKLFAEQQFEDLAYFEPFYLKDFVAIPSKKDVLGLNK